MTKIFLINKFILFLFILILILLSLLCAIYFNNKNEVFLSSIFANLFIGLILLVITVFIVEQLIDKYQESRWGKTKDLINKMVEDEIRDDLVMLVYTLDQSETGVFPSSRLSHYITDHGYYSTPIVVRHAKSLLEIIKLDDFADHTKLKYRDKKIENQLYVFNQYKNILENNIKNLDWIITFSQIKITGDFYSKLIRCRKESKEFYNFYTEYNRILKVNETEHKLDINVTLEFKFKKAMYKSGIKVMNTMIEILYDVNNNVENNHNEYFE